jgi:hypothetical protein
VYLSLLFKGLQRFRYKDYGPWQMLSASTFGLEMAMKKKVKKKKA